MDGKKANTPFLKWAGGKRWLVSAWPKIFPEKYNRYIEPFLGSAAVFFYLRPDNAILSDCNANLINVYRAIQCDWERVVRYLEYHDKKHSEKYYYSIRSMAFRCEYKEAARFIYLNRTCWNGLYRVNLKGRFNVPIGTKTKVILDTDDFEKISKSLGSVELLVSDFEDVIDRSKDGDLLFVDPPYTVTHNYNGFIKYNEELFSRDDQYRLRDCLVSAVDRGVKVISTNADHDFIRKLYKEDFFLNSINRKSFIAASSKYRGAFNELVIARL